MTNESPLFSQRPSRVLALEWFDGPITGFLDYGPGSQAYHFRLITSEASEPRAFALQPSRIRTLEEIETALAPLGQPRRPVWVPDWKFGIDEDRELADRVIATATPHELPVSAIVVARSISDVPIAARILGSPLTQAAFGERLAARAEGEEWLTFCKLP